MTMKAVQAPPTWKSHEAEDLANMSRVLFSQSTNYEKWDEGSIHEAHYLSQQLGTKLPSSILDLGQNLGPCTLQGRLKTFPEDWDGWRPLPMALTGLYVTEAGKVKCYVCDVEFRKMTSTSVCFLQRHKDLAPCCLQLRRCQCQGTRATPPGRRVRHNSDSVIRDMEVEEN
ncbi:uncharacterized protein LOC143279382 [Babylonia areolata]|uniref:uncharacterized protein LOC143279382 n=1 Tax=Babylonia areolata TaxID=304850 RepID=UPI003FCFC23C